MSRPKPFPTPLPSSARQVEISLPDEHGRHQILSIHTAKMRENKYLSPEVSLEHLAAETKNFSGAEIEGLVRSATSWAFGREVTVENVKRGANAENLMVSADGSAGTNGGGESSHSLPVSLVTRRPCRLSGARPPRGSPAGTPYLTPAPTPTLSPPQVTPLPPADISSTPADPCSPDLHFLHSHPR